MLFFLNFIIIFFFICKFVSLKTSRKELVMVFHCFVFCIKYSILFGSASSVQKLQGRDVKLQWFTVYHGDTDKICLAKVT